MNEPAKVFQDRVKPDRWRVEWFDDDGRSEVEIFVGETARQDALQYAEKKYRRFEEVQLEPYPPALDAAGPEPRRWRQSTAPARLSLLPGSECGVGQDEIDKICRHDQMTSVLSLFKSGISSMKAGVVCGLLRIAGATEKTVAAVWVLLSALTQPASPSLIAAPSARVR